MDFELVVRSAIIGAAVSSVFYAIIMWMAGAPAPVSAGNVYTLVHGPAFRVAGYCFIAFAAFFAISSQLPRRLPVPGEDWVYLGEVVACAGAGVFMLNEARRRVLLSGQGIEVLSPWGRRTVRLPWSEVSSVAFSHRKKQFTIRGRSGQKVAVSVAMVAMPALADNLRQYLPPAAYADALDQYAQFARSQQLFLEAAKAAADAAEPRSKD